jgi:hypothetical protein
MDIPLANAEDLFEQLEQVLSLRALIHEFFQKKF